jgi:hypothetical protein
MSNTDEPLKALVEDNILDVASWLLGVEVIAAEDASGELTTTTPIVDMLFRLRLADQRICLFHLEFQGRRSKPEMERRQLNHLSRLALRNEWPVALESFVLYVEKNAGNNDTGQYQLSRLDGSSAIAWHYTPIHLWKEPAERLLQVKRRGIIPLMALMDIQQPERTLPEMVRRLQAEPDEGKRHQLFTSLFSLLNDEEYFKMIDTLLESETFRLDTPFLRRIRQEAKQEAKKENILDFVKERYHPDEQILLEIQERLATIQDTQKLDQLFKKSIRTDALIDFLGLLAQPSNE